MSLTLENRSSWNIGTAAFNILFGFLGYEDLCNVCRMQDAIWSQAALTGLKTWYTKDFGRAVELLTPEHPLRNFDLTFTLEGVAMNRVQVIAKIQRAQGTVLREFIDAGLIGTKHAAVPKIYPLVTFFTKGAFVGDGPVRALTIAVGQATTVCDPEFLNGLLRDRFDDRMLLMEGIFGAIEGGNLVVFELLFNKAEPVTEEEFKRLLSAAGRSEHVAALQALLQKKEVSSGAINSALQDAVRAGRVRAVEFLLRQHHFLLERMFNFLVYLAVEAGHLEVLKVLLKEKSFPTIFREALKTAVEFGKLPIVNYLLEVASFSQGDLEIVSEARSRGHVEIAAVLEAAIEKLKNSHS